MDSPNLSELNFERSGSRLLSETSLIPSNSSSSSISNLSRTGPGGDDLSLSELSLSECPQHVPSRRPKFSLLAQPLPQRMSSHSDDSAIADKDADEDGLDHTMTQEDVERAKKLETKTREEKLQHDLFILKKLNYAFEVYKEALKEAKSGTERVAEQLKNTDALLNKYVNILSKTENAARLIMDERWQGAEADEKRLEREHRETIERRQREEEERRLALQREKERLKREEQERKEAEDRAKLDMERAESARVVSRGSGVRGVRGTRASMRGMRGTSVPRAAPASAPSTRGIRGTSMSGLRRPTVVPGKFTGMTGRGVPTTKRG